MKSAIKTAVAELLPALAARPSDTDLLPGERTVDADGKITEHYSCCTLYMVML